MTVSEILAEIKLGDPIMPERVKWFREMLENAITNREDDILFFSIYPPSPSATAQYSADAIKDIIQRKRDLIATYQDALYVLESGCTQYVEMTWADAMNWAANNKVPLGRTEEQDFAATQDLRRFHLLPLIRLVDQRGRRPRMPHPLVGGCACNVYAKGGVYKKPPSRREKGNAVAARRQADAALQTEAAE